MGIFNEFVSSIIGVLLVALSGLGVAPTTATSTPETTVSTTQSTSTGVRSEAKVLSELYSSLVGIQTRFELKNKERAGKVEDSSEHRSQDDAQRSATGALIVETHRGGTETAEEHALRESQDDSDDDSERRGRGRDDDDDEDDDDRGRNQGSGSPSSNNGSSNSGNVQPVGSAVAGITMTTVALHNTQASCYTVVNGSVYNVTSWIAKHPGGQAAIKGMCGVDASASFSGQHGGEARPESELAGFKIGTLIR